MFLFRFIASANINLAFCPSDNCSYGVINIKASDNPTLVKILIASDTESPTNSIIGKFDSVGFLGTYQESSFRIKFLISEVFPTPLKPVI